MSSKYILLSDVLNVNGKCAVDMIADTPKKKDGIAAMKAVG